MKLETLIKIVIHTTLQTKITMATRIITFVVHIYNAFQKDSKNILKKSHKNILYIKVL